MVVIVDDPAKGIVDGNLIFHDGMKQPCQHLQGDKLGEYSCAIHNEKWYDETPCFSHGQIEQGNTNCRLGEYILKQAGIKIPDKEKNTSTVVLMKVNNGKHRQGQ